MTPATKATVDELLDAFASAVEAWTDASRTSEGSFDRATLRKEEAHARITASIMALVADSNRLDWLERNAYEITTRSGGDGRPDQPIREWIDKMAAAQ